MLESYENEDEERIGIGFYLAVIGGGLIAFSIVVLAMAYYFEALWWTKNTSEIPVASEKQKAKRILSKNKPAAKAAWNAVGEMNSVASVGSNFVQFTTALQNSKIKFDAALRDFDEPTDEDNEIISLLESSMQCFLDAKEAWSEFLKEGNEYGFLLPRTWSRVDPWAKRYGYTRDRNNGYFREDVLGAIFKQGSKEWSDLGSKIR